MDSKKKTNEKNINFILYLRYVLPSRWILLCAGELSAATKTTPWIELCGRNGVDGVHLPFSLLRIIVLILFQIESDGFVSETEKKKSNRKLSNQLIYGAMLFLSCREL